MANPLRPPDLPVDLRGDRQGGCPLCHRRVHQHPSSSHTNSTPRGQQTSTPYLDRRARRGTASGSSDAAPSRPTQQPCPDANAWNAVRAFRAKEQGRIDHAGPPRTAHLFRQIAHHGRQAPTSASRPTCLSENRSVPTSRLAWTADAIIKQREGPTEPRTRTGLDLRRDRLVLDVHHLDERTVGGRTGVRPSPIQQAPSPGTTFPLPAITQRPTDRAIDHRTPEPSLLDARRLHPDKSLADLYRPAAHDCRRAARKRTTTSTAGWTAEFGVTAEQAHQSCAARTPCSPRTRMLTAPLLAVGRSSGRPRRFRGRDSDARARGTPGGGLEYSVPQYP
jgi:hypothetical protein